MVQYGPFGKKSHSGVVYADLQSKMAPRNIRSDHAFPVGVKLSLLCMPALRQRHAFAPL